MFHNFVELIDGDDLAAGHAGDFFEHFRPGGAADRFLGRALHEERRVERGARLLAR